MCQHFRYAQSLSFMRYYNKQQVLWIDERSANKYNNYSSASTILKMALFTYLEYSRVDG